MRLSILATPKSKRHPFRGSFRNKDAEALLKDDSFLDHKNAFKSLLAKKYGSEIINDIKRFPELILFPTIPQ